MILFVWDHCNQKNVQTITGEISWMLTSRHTNENISLELTKRRENKLGLSKITRKII